MDIKLHKIMLSKILISIYKDSFLWSTLGFKWWTCAMFFYELPRLSVDLDFGVLWKYDENKEKNIISSMEQILKDFWEITDFARKKNTILFEIRYKNDERRLKIEISTRWESGRFLTKNFLWENIYIMNEEDLFSNKLIALLNRKWITNRDIFDIWFFLSKWVDINEKIISDFTWEEAKNYLLKVKEFIQKYDFNKILYWLWEMLDEKQKNFAKTKMKDEILEYLDFYI
jgi:predicted nucleotidyltransferase component of viral defense system